MKKNISSTKARAVIGTLFLIVGVSLIVLALLPTSSRSAARRATGKNRKAPIVLAPPAPVDPGTRLGFENFEGPGVLTPVVTGSQGQPVNTVEYIAHDAGEPSIGVNWNTDVTAFQSDLETLFVTFNDTCQTATPKATWVNRPAPTSQGVDQDPIGFVDRITGRTFAAQLTLTSPTCKTSYTDDDGHTWVATAGFGIGSGIDHQTIGGGPYALPAPVPVPSFPHAYYYCSQLPAAACARSDDGGLTFGPAIEIDPVGDAHCVGIHGHVEVTPDTAQTQANGQTGTVYVPTFNCDGQGSVIVSQDNGLTWSIRHVPNTSSGGDIIDAQVGIDNSGRVYFIMANGDGRALVATSTDRGLNWSTTYDIGASYGVKTTSYPYAVAADTNRAAVAFLGSTKAGSVSDHGFNGVWHLYIAATYDGGATWTTTDATPNDPLQRGCIWAQGGADICRNLLDFIGASVDKEGRIEVAYVDGCPDGACAQALVNPDGTSGVVGNSYTARGVIARQSSGRRLVAAFDPPTATSVPGMPLVTERRIGRTIHLGWSEADDGNSPITSYQIFRGTASGAETLLTTVPATQTKFDDLTATDINQTYFYKVLAVNAIGTSCANNEIAASYVGDGCTGFIVQKTPPGHPEQTTQGQTPASLAIDYVAVAEPPNTSNFMFQMKVTSLSGGLPPSSRWRIVWNSYAAAGQQFYVGMRTDSNSAATFDYGTIATAVVGLVIGVPTETKTANALPGSNFQPDGTITVIVPKSVFGNPQPGDLLGAVNGRTFTGDTQGTQNLERSNALMDHTFVKAQRDNGHPAATYTVLGNNACEGGIVPTAVSRKTHDSISPPFDVDLPLSGNLGIECRKGQGANSDQHQIVVTFPGSITLVGTPTVSSGTGSVSTAIASSNQVFINLTGVTNAQRMAVTLTVNDGVNTGPVVVPMGVLLGDVDASGRVDATDVFQVRQQTLQNATSSNFRDDVDESGRIDSTDVFITRQQTLTSLP